MFNKKCIELQIKAARIDEIQRHYEQVHQSELKFAMQNSILEKEVDTLTTTVKELNDKILKLQAQLQVEREATETVIKDRDRLKGEVDRLQNTLSQHIHENITKEAVENLENTSLGKFTTNMRDICNEFVEKVNSAFESLSK